MNERTATENFILNIERERFERNISQRAMAQLLQVPLSTYKKIVSGQTEKISLAMILRMHDLTGKMVWQLVGADPDAVSSVHDLYMMLDPARRQAVHEYVSHLAYEKYMEDHT